jgi:cytoskeleton protein RodZ
VAKVGSFGERLRREREQRNISLEQIVAVTKIGRRLLVALEEEQFDLLPGGIFNKAYVRAYAKCIGINEDEAVALYLEAAQEPPPDTKVIAHQHSFHSDRMPDRASFPIVPVLILLVVAAGAVGGWKTYQDHRSERERIAAAGSHDAVPPQNSDAVPASTPSPATVTPSGAEQRAANTAPAPSTATTGAATPASTIAAPATTTSTATAGATPLPPGSFEVTVSPKGPAWVSVKADGKYVVRGIIKPPDVKTVRATGEVVFYTGNAGALEVSFNGKNIPLAGGSNTEQVLVITPQGVMPRTAPQ